MNSKKFSFIVGVTMCSLMATEPLSASPISIIQNNANVMATF